MSEITALIQRYQAGQVPFEDLLKDLGERDYPPPARAVDQPKDPYAREIYIDNMPAYTDGTWDEVRRARNFGLLTADEYMQLVQRVWESHGGGQDGKTAPLPGTRCWHPSYGWGRLSGRQFLDEKGVSHEVKGDLPGHEFHGNQWTGGGGGELQPEARTALKRYTAGGYDAINSHLRGLPFDAYDDDQRKEDQANAQAYVAEIDRLMQPLASEATVFRGIGPDAIAKLTGLDAAAISGNDEGGGPLKEPMSFEEVGAALDDLKGTEFEDKGFVSTSMEDRIAGGRVTYGGSGQTMVELSVPVGIKALDINQALGEEHAFASEKELLLERGLRFRIDGIRPGQATAFYSDKVVPIHVLQVSVVGP